MKIKHFVGYYLHLLLLWNDRDGKELLFITSEIFKALNNKLYSLSIPVRQHLRLLLRPLKLEERITLQRLQMVTCCCISARAGLLFHSNLSLQFKQIEVQLSCLHLQIKGCLTAPWRASCSPTHPFPEGCVPLFPRISTHMAVGHSGSSWLIQQKPSPFSRTGSPSHQPSQPKQPPSPSQETRAVFSSSSTLKWWYLCTAKPSWFSVRFGTWVYKSEVQQQATNAGYFPLEMQGRGAYLSRPARQGASLHCCQATRGSSCTYAASLPRAACSCAVHRLGSFQKNLHRVQHNTEPSKIPKTYEESEDLDIQV